MTTQIIRAYTATAAVINPRRIVKFDATTQTSVLQAAAAGDNIIGITTEIPAAANERVDVVHNGVAYIEAGAAFNAGVLLTSDAVGRAVAAAPAVGANNRVVGIALEQATAAGDVVYAFINPASVQG